MSQLYPSEDQCSHEFYAAIKQTFDIRQIRIHGTGIEEVEGVDVVYICDFLNRFKDNEAKALLFQEKAPNPPPYTFRLEQR